MGFYISKDKNKLDVTAIHRAISEESYWGRGRSVGEVQTTIENSLCFGLFNEINEQIGFARLVTDYVFFGYIMDVIILDKNYKGMGLGKKLISHLLKDEVIKNLKTLALKTKDAHQLYERYGFTKIGDSALWMSIDKQNLL
ncbi:hypothetical protein LCGC14_1091850 [marine sediment metagenome]|uniref:N-acetyltransferase n=2 Tax=root TaxID=1 RepID=A0A831VSJ2_9FLAO|nr:N-acetyltransferase [Pricia antarctica]